MTSRILGSWLTALALLSGCADDEGNLDDLDKNVVGQPDAGETLLDADIEEADAAVTVDAEVTQDAGVAIDATSGSDAAAADASVPTPDAAAPAPLVGFPCEVQAIVESHCARCHGPTAKNGTSLVNRDDWLLMAKKDATVRVADRVLLRMAAVEMPMPPAGKGEPVSEADRAVIESWIEQGLPSATCEE